MSRQCGAIDRAKQDAILDAAIDVAGSAELSLAAIARRARVSRQTVYNHFGGVPGLKRAVLDWCRAALQEPFQEFPAQSDTRAALAAYAESALKHMRTARYHRAVRAVGRVLPDDKALANAICAEISKDCTACLRAFLRQETRAGRLKGLDPDQAAEEFHTMATARPQLRMLTGLFNAAECGDASAQGRILTDRFLKQFSPPREKTSSASPGRGSNDGRAQNQP